MSGLLLQSVVNKGTGGAGQANYGNFATLLTANATVANNVINASPMVVPVSGDILAFGAIVQATVATSLFNVAFYNNQNNYTLSPTTLVAPASSSVSGSLSGSAATGLVLFTVPLKTDGSGRSTLYLDAGIYWAAVMTGTAAPNLFNVAPGGALPFLGTEATGTGNQKVTVANTYAATYPNTFPTGFVYSTANMPVIIYQYQM